MSLASALYEGTVTHTRRDPAHRFSMRLCMLYVDLDELDEVFASHPLWQVERTGVAVFRRRDHLGDVRRPLAESVRRLVAERAGRRPEGPIRLLTHPRYFGYVFNPLSVYYCFDRAGRRVESLVAEVSNTPWNERHCYVLAREPDDDRPTPGEMRFRTPKVFHVSPFQSMDLVHRWRLNEPGHELCLAIGNEKPGGGASPFAASLVMRRREIDVWSLTRALLVHPAMTARVIAGIYWQAWRIRRKGARVHPHPAESRGEEAA